MEQLTIPFLINTPKTFDYFIAGENDVLINQLRDAVIKKKSLFYYIWGDPGSGCSHLLNAICAEATRQAESSIHLPLRDIELAPSILDNLEESAWVCLDDIDSIAQNHSWSVAIFHLYNRLIQCGHSLVMSGHASPFEITWSLPDLGSRIKACFIERLKPLNDEEKRNLLMQQAWFLGLEMPVSVADYLLTHCARDNKTLQKVIKKLDQASLTQQRRLTIPFVKQTLKLAT